jgi:hypothetical protein
LRKSVTTFRAISGDIGLADRLEEAGRRGLLQEVTRRTVADRLEDALLLAVDGEHEDFDGGPAPPDDANSFAARHPRQIDVEEEDVRQVRRERRQGVLDALEGARTAVAVASVDEKAQTFPRRPVVLDDRDPDFSGAGGHGRLPWHSWIVRAGRIRRDGIFMLFPVLHGGPRAGSPFRLRPRT